MELAANQAKPPKQGSLALGSAFSCTVSIGIALLITLLIVFTGFLITVSTPPIFIIIIDLLFFTIILIIPYLYLQLDNIRRKLLFALWMPFSNLLFILSISAVNQRFTNIPSQVAETVNIFGAILFIIWNLSSFYLARGEQIRQKFNSGGKLTLFSLLNLVTTPLGVVTVGIVYEAFDSRGGRILSLLSVLGLGVLWANVYLNALFFCLQKDNLLVYSKGWFACFGTCFTNTKACFCCRRLEDNPETSAPNVPENDNVTQSDTSESIPQIQNLNSRLDGNSCRSRCWPVSVIVFFILVVCVVLALNIFVFKHKPQEPPETLEALVGTLDDLLLDLASNPSQLTIEKWITSFASFHQTILKIGSGFSVDTQTAFHLRTDCLEILQILLDQPKAWNFFPISERIQILDNLQVILAEMAVILHSNGIITQSTMANNAVIELQTKGVYLISGTTVQFTFGPDFSLSLPLSGLNPNIYPLGSVLYISAVLIRGLSSYLSFDYPINSQVLSLVVGNEKSGSILVNDQKMTFRSANLENLTADYVPGCTTWDPWASRWSPDVCQLHPSSDSSTTVCECRRIATYASIDKPAIEEIIEKLENLLDQIIANQGEIPKDDWIDYLQNTTDWVSQALETNLSAVEPEQGIALTRPAVEILNILIDQPKVWEKKLNRFERTRASSAIFHSIEDLSVLMDITQLHSNQDVFEIRNLTSIQLETRRFPVKPNGSIEFTFPDYQISLPFAAFPAKSLNRVVLSTAAVVRNLSPYLSADLHHQRGHLLKTNILSLVVNSNRTGELQIAKNLTFSTRFNKDYRLRFNHRPSCDWWNFSSLSWNSSGCTYLESESDRRQSVCACSHLTNFAVLIDVNNEEIPETPKTILSTFCSSLTVFLSVWAMAILLKKAGQSTFDLRKKRIKKTSLRSRINFHIAIWLCATHLMVLLFLDQDGPLMRPLLENWLADWPFTCGLTSLALLYCLLTLFTLLLLLNYHLYCSVVKVKPTAHHLNARQDQGSLSKEESLKLNKYLFLAYVYPLILILLTLLGVYFIELRQVKWKIDEHSPIEALANFFIDFFNPTDSERWSETIQSMSGQYFCWLSSKEYPYHIYIFVGPMSLIIAVNLLLLAQSAFVYLRMVYFGREALIRSPSRPPVNRRRQQVKLVHTCFFFFNSCLPWGMYVFYLQNWLFAVSGAKIFSLLFIALTGTQGLALFTEQYILYKSKTTFEIEGRRESISQSTPTSR